jgi:hypothetical protein
MGEHLKVKISLFLGLTPAHVILVLIDMVGLNSYDRVTGEDAPNPFDRVLVAFLGSGGLIRDNFYSVAVAQLSHGLNIFKRS